MKYTIKGVIPVTVASCFDILLYVSTLLYYISWSTPPRVWYQHYRWHLAFIYFCIAVLYFMKHTTRVWSLEDILQRRQQGAKCLRGWIAARQKIYAVWYTIVYTYTHIVHHGGTSITSVGGTPNQYSSNIQILPGEQRTKCQTFSVYGTPGIYKLYQV